MDSTHFPDQTPSVIVLFGITGDLARIKVMPAIYQLFKNDAVHDDTFIVGISRRNVDPTSIIDTLKSQLAEFDDQVMQRLQDHLSMVSLQPDVPNDYQHLKQYLQALEDKAGVCLQRFFYLSIPPQVFSDVVQNLGQQGLQHGCDHGSVQTRLLIEKPFGFDATSAQSLIDQTAEYFDESQLFRIDHYLAKETAQNILVFRKQNPLFSQIWNRQHISRVSITAAEAIGIEGRANFYEQTGALRDLIQSHLLQLLAMTLMDVPETIEAEAVHTSKLNVLESLEPIPIDEAHKRSVRGQYVGYRDDVNNQASNTETFASVVLYSNHPDWQGIPLRLTTGKALKIKRTSITVDFGEPGVNRLQFRIQPNEGITLTLQVKRPGLSDDVTQTTMDFDYESAFQSAHLEAYERVLLDAMRGDQTLFASDSEVLASWKLLQPLLDSWSQSSDDLATYERGSDGPDVSKLAGA